MLQSALTEQADDIRKKIEQLQASLSAIEQAKSRSFTNADGQL